MTPNKYDHILIHRNPYRQYSKPKQTEYKDPKFLQLRIYFKCESTYYSDRTH